MQQQESEKKINIKLQGQDVQSFFNLALKMDSSIMGIDDKSMFYEKGRLSEYNSKIDLFDNNNGQTGNIISIQGDQLKKKDSSIVSDSECQKLKIDLNTSIKGLDNNTIDQSDYQQKTIQDQPATQHKLKRNQTIIYSTQKANHQRTMIKHAPTHTNPNNQNDIKQKKGSKLNAFNTTEKLVKLFTIFKPQLISFIDNHTMFGRHRQFKQKSRIIIGDKADHIDFQGAKSKNILIRFIMSFRFIFQFLEKIFFMMLDKIPLFNPENKLRIMVNAIIVCYNSFYLLLISFNIFFKANFGNVQHTFHQIATAAWVIEMFIQMNTATYHEGDFITDRKVIFKIYLKEYFFFEILPLIFEGRSSPNTLTNILLHLPLLLKLKGMMIILTKLEFLILQHLKRHYILKISKLLLQLLLLIHLMACSYITLAKYEQNILNLPYTWLEKSELFNQNENWWNAYIEAQLWAFYTMSSSYSHSVYTEYEYAFTSFWILISCILFAYLVNTLGNILQEINSVSENYQKDVNVLNRYMKRKKIDLELQRVMNTHLLKQYEQESQDQFDAEQEALKKLSSHMRNKLVTESNKDILEQFSLFHVFQQKTLENIYQIMEEESYTEGQIIQTFDTNSLDNFIYLIMQGSVQIVQVFTIQGRSNDQEQTQMISDDKKRKDSDILESQKVIETLSVGNKFGEVEFFSNTSFPYIVRSVKQTVVIKISRKKLVSVMSQSKADYQKFMEIKQRIQFYSQMYAINSNCYICNTQSHSFLECNQTHFPKLSEFLICRLNRSFNQSRQSYERKMKKTLRCIVKIISELENNTENKQSELSNEIEDEESQWRTNVKQSNPNIVLGQTINSNNNNLNSVLKIKNDNLIDDQGPGDIVSLNQEMIQKNNEDIQSIFKKTVQNNNSTNGNNSNVQKGTSFRLSLIQKKSLINQDISQLSQEQKDFIEERISQLDEKNIRKQSLTSANELINNQSIQNIIIHSKSQINNSNIKAIRKSLQNNSPLNIQSQQNSQDSDQNILSSLHDINLYQKQTSGQNKNSSLVQILAPKRQLQNSQQKNTIEMQPEANQLMETIIYKYQWDRSFFYWDFEKKQEFSHFFPNNNCKNVLKKLENRERYLKEKKKIQLMSQIQQ